MTAVLSATSAPPTVHKVTVVSHFRMLIVFAIEKPLLRAVYQARVIVRLYGAVEHAQCPDDFREKHLARISNVVSAFWPELKRTRADVAEFESEVRQAIQIIERIES